MVPKSRPTVWSYMTVDEDHKPLRRTIFFYAGSTVYNGGWLGPSDCFWIVPEPSPWNRESV